jgi:phospholipase/carboxylesterase
MVAALEAFDDARRNYFPGIVPRLRESFPAFTRRLKESIEAFAAAPAGTGTEKRQKQLLQAAGFILDALERSTEAEWLEQSLVNFRKAGRRICRAEETLYAFCDSIEPLNRYFLEPPVRERAGEFTAPSPAPASAGLLHLGLEEQPYARSGYSLYIPETWDGVRPRPLVIALHGGFSHGRDFIWTWLREARSRRFLLAAPSSRGITWSITGPDVDSVLLHDMLDHIRKRWALDEERILLTGLSDGGTYALTRSLDEQTFVTAYAVVSGVLPPFNLRYAAGKRICWVHGARDWMFPLWQAKTGYKRLMEAGADVTQVIVPDLYHAYPREQNDCILTWFDPLLALPPAPARHE